MLTRFLSAIIAIRIVLLILVAQLATSSCVALPANKFDYSDLPDWKWVYETWNPQNDKDFAHIRKRMEKEVASTWGHKLPQLVQKYKKQAQSNPKNAEAQYAWTYATTKSRGAGYVQPENQFIVAGNLSYALHNAAWPHSYEYSRLRFIITAWWKDFPQLKPLGARLLLRNPNDYAVKRSQVYLLAQGTAAEQTLAITYAKQLTKLRPRDNQSWGALSFAYWRRADSKKSFPDADAAYQAGLKSLSLTPKDPVSYARAKDFVATVKRSREQYRPKN